MSKSEEILRLERDINEQPELQEKLNAEIRRIAEAGEAQRTIASRPDLPLITSTCIRSGWGLCWDTTNESGC